MGIFLGFSIGLPALVLFVPSYALSDYHPDGYTLAHSGTLPIHDEVGAVSGKLEIEVDKKSHKLMGKNKVRVLSAVACFWLTAASLNKFGLCLFVWHPILMGVGCIGLMSEGVLAYHHVRNKGGFCPGMDKDQDGLWHRRINSAAATCIVLAVMIILTHKFKNGLPTFSGTLHGMFGIAASLCITVQVAVGISKVFSKPYTVNKWHGQMGMVVYYLSFTAAATGVLVGFTNGASIMLVFVFFGIAVFTTRLRSELIVS